MNARQFAARGFTLIELLVVMSIIAILLTIAVPKYFGSVDRSKEVALKQSLLVMRDAIDKFYGDTGTYPATLDDLVAKKYLRNIPPDPMTDSMDTWVIVAPEDSKLSGVILLNDLALAAERISRPADNGISHADVMGVLKAVSGSG